MDSVVDTSVALFRKTVAMETKLGMLLTNNKAYQVLSDRITVSTD